VNVKHILALVAAVTCSNVALATARQRTISYWSDTASGDALCRCRRIDVEVTSMNVVFLQGCWQRWLLEAPAPLEQTAQRE